MIRSRLAAVVAALSALVACGSDSGIEVGDASSTRPAATTTPSTTAAASTTAGPSSTVTTVPASTAIPVTTGAGPVCVAPSDLPLMVRADADGYDTVGVSEGLGAGDDRPLVLFADGGVVAAQIGEDDDRSIEWRIGPAGGGGPSGTIEAAVLHDLVVTGTGTAILYGEIYQGDGEPLAHLLLMDLDTGETIRIAESQAVEYFVYRAAAADGIVVTSAVADLSEDISTWALDGSGRLDRFTPVTPEDYGLAPFFGPAVPSPDGSRLAWLEGPDVVGPDPEPVGDWQLVVGDARSGEESLRLRIGTADDEFVWFDWDGEWAVLSRGQGQPVLLVHTSEADPTPRSICDDRGRGLLSGVVTFVVT